jgi:ubiquinone/menaquinone biosynthesis C-methylase UbiE
MDTKTYFENYYSDSNWKETWDNADERLGSVMNIMQKYPKHLDVGCADGMFTRFYLNLFPHTDGYGVDISNKAVELAKINCPDGFFQQADAIKLPFKSNFFDMVHSTECIEHIGDPQKAIDECYRVLKKGGVLITTIPFPNKEREEHLWKWTKKGKRLIEKSRMTIEMFSKFRLIGNNRVFRNRMLYVVFQK